MVVVVVVENERDQEPTGAKTQRVSFLATDKTVLVEPFPIVSLKTLFPGEDALRRERVEKGAKSLNRARTNLLVQFDLERAVETRTYVETDKSEHLFDELDEGGEEEEEGTHKTN